MKGRMTGLTIAVLAAVAVAGICFWNNRDETQIRRTLTKLGGCVAKVRGESPAAGALKGAGLDRFFAAKVRFSSDMPGIQREITPAEMKPFFIQSRSQCDTVSVDWEILKLTISGTHASAECNLAVSGSVRGEAEKFTGLRHGTFELEKINGKWKITQCILAAPLKE